MSEIYFIRTKKTDYNLMVTLFTKVLFFALYYSVNNLELKIILNGIL